MVQGGDGLYAPVKAGRKTSWKELGYRADLVVWTFDSETMYKGKFKAEITEKKLTVGESKWARSSPAFWR